MKVLCMPQAFKGSIKARDAAAAMVQGVARVLPAADIEALPMADGGDDTLDVLIDATHGRYVTTEVCGPMGDPVQAEWGVLGDGETAVIEMAQASGLRLLKNSERDPRWATTIGTGQLIRAALKAGHRKIIVGVGGSATVDAGAGVAKALGVHFRDINGRELQAGGADLINLHSIDVTFLDHRLQAASVRAACDVDIPLCGPRGAWNFAAQKGASDATCRELARGLERFADVVRDSLGVDLRSMPLAGPGGGISGGMHAILGAALVSGPDLVLDAIDADTRIASADLVVVGEGRMDSNTFWGKGPSAVAVKSKNAGVPVVAVVGQLGADVPDLRSHGIQEAESLLQHADSEREAMSRAYELIVTTTEAAVSRHAAANGLAA